MPQLLVQEKNEQKSILLPFQPSMLASSNIYINETSKPEILLDFTFKELWITQGFQFKIGCDNEKVKIYIYIYPLNIMPHMRSCNFLWQMTCWVRIKTVWWELDKYTQLSKIITLQNLYALPGITVPWALHTLDTDC